VQDNRRIKRAIVRPLVPQWLRITYTKHISFSKIHPGFDRIREEGVVFDLTLKPEAVPLVFFVYDVYWHAYKLAVILSGFADTKYLPLPYSSMRASLSSLFMFWVGGFFD
jgi:hypothetical protein